MANRFFASVERAIRYWYLPLIAGLVFLIVGFYTFSCPLGTYLTLSALFSLSFLLSGLFEIFVAISNRREIENWGWMLMSGIVTFLIGWLMMANPKISIITLPLYIGFIVLFRSVGAISTSLDLRKYDVADWGVLTIIGVAGVILSFILLWNPLFAGLTIVFWTAATLIISGIFSIWLAIKLRHLKRFSKE